MKTIYFVGYEKKPGYALRSSNRLMKELQEKYLTKGENIVNIDGLTISFDEMRLTEEGNLETAISSRIPPELNEDGYFRCFSEALKLFPNKPVSIEHRKQAIRDKSGDILKERGYIDVVYCYSDAELYPNDEEIIAEAMDIKYALKKDKVLPKYLPEENISLEGRLVLKHVMDSMYKHRKAQIDDILRADEFAKELLEGKKQ